MRARINYDKFIYAFILNINLIRIWRWFKIKKLYFVNENEKNYTCENINEVIDSFFHEPIDSKMQRVNLIRMLRLWIEIFNINFNDNYGFKDNIYDLAIKDDNVLIDLINFSNMKRIIVGFEE